MKIEKYKLWLLFFFIIFGFTFGMIIWTVKSAEDTPVYEDRSFLSNYHTVDDNFNQIVNDNMEFSKKYRVVFNINGNTIDGLDISDIYLGQRSIEKRGRHKGFLHFGSGNSISVSIRDMDSGDIVDSASVHLLLSKAIDSKGDMEFNSSIVDGYEYRFNGIDIPYRGYWNLNAKLIIGDI
ncbi:MAG: hypothetical protein GXO06_00235 [Epsilonproteobacteria bacterium]|nr:hypothetical protein [Campylobacterota bacterium]